MFGLAWLPVVLIALLCPLIMVGMMAYGWLFRRGQGGSHAGCGMGHGGHHPEPAKSEKKELPEAEKERGALLEELKAQRQRLDELIARVEVAERSKGQP